MTPGKIIWARVALVVLTLAGLVGLYQVLFAVWMTAYPFANLSEWRTRLCIRLATTIVIGLCWSVLAVWLYRQRRHRQKPPIDMSNGQSSAAR
jgi:antibiotic biosynthesis monooxygenase (ABM) superfamily enzyme